MFNFNLDRHQALKLMRIWVRIRNRGYEVKKITGTAGFCNGPEGFKVFGKNGMQQNGLTTNTGTVDGIQSRGR
jgi:hypothetical protein